LTGAVFYRSRVRPLIERTARLDSGRRSEFSLP
jgi:hypothetical protein